MVFYFSGTGNSRFVARNIARALGQELADITEGVQIVGNVLLIISVIMTIISGVDYLLKNKDFLKETK